MTDKPNENNNQQQPPIYGPPPQQPPVQVPPPVAPPPKPDKKDKPITAKVAANVVLIVSKPSFMYCIVNMVVAGGVLAFAIKNLPMMPELNHGLNNNQV